MFSSKNRKYNCNGLKFSPAALTDPDDITRHHSAEQGREAPGECPVTLFGLDVGPVTCRGVTVFIHNRFFDHVNFD